MIFWTIWNNLGQFNAISDLFWKMTGARPSEARLDEGSGKLERKMAIPPQARMVAFSHQYDLEYLDRILSVFPEDLAKQAEIIRNLILPVPSERWSMMDLQCFLERTDPDGLKFEADPRVSVDRPAPPPQTKVASPKVQKRRRPPVCCTIS